MPVPIKRLLKSLGVCFMLLFSAFQSYGSHIFGIDLYYTYVSGYTYNINLVVFGDCSGAAFSTLSASSPIIHIYNGGTYIIDVTLALQTPTSGLDVTPVCPADATNTTCYNPSSTIPGIKKFVYSANVTLSGTSTDWRFLFQGDMGGGAQAGRSNSITNINIPGSGSLIELVDTLNNVPGPNSSAIFSSIATPFFCINIPANYNPAAVAPAGDLLSFSLVPAIDGTTGGSVNYIFPYSATAPLAVTPGSTSFNSTNGQLSFTPNAIQRSLVVYNVEEFRGGVMVGTSQREMSFVVISPCSGTPPNSNITAPTAGSLIGGTQLNICSNIGAFNFQLNPTDAAGDTVSVSVSGLPGGATFNITNNNTPAPHATFSWTTTSIAPGIYNFYVTYTGHSCPLTTTQTIAYTIEILQAPTETVSIVSEPSCTREGILNIIPGGPPAPWSFNVLSGSTSIHTLVGITGTFTDSLPPGTYTYRIYNGYGCYTDASITLTAPALPTPVVSVAPPLCIGGSTGTATITGTHGTAPYTYAVGTAPYVSGGVFTGLSTGVYTLYVKDANGCVKDTVVMIPNANPILDHAHITKPLCNNDANGIIVIQGYNTAAPYTYALGSGAYNVNDTFSNLAAGVYSLSIKDGNGCIATFTITLSDSENIHATLNITGVPCYGDSAIVRVIASGGFGPPYTYSDNGGTVGSSNIFTVPVGIYSIQVIDAQSCYFDTTITISQPLPITFAPVITNVLCYNTNTGSVLVNVTGGTPGYLYDTSGGTYAASSTLSGLWVGIHIINVKDANGCIYADTINITQPMPLGIDSVSSTMPSCNGGSNGIITVYAYGGTPAYSYAGNTGSYGSSNILTGLSAGSNTVYVRDANGCIHDTIVSLSQPTAITSTALVTNSTCSTLANGRITVFASGGTPSYDFAINSGGYSPAGFSSTFASLAAGTYTLHIRDANGCIHDTTIAIRDSLHISGIFTITPTSCFGDSTGSILVNGSGGSSPYLYGINIGPLDTSYLFPHLISGVYFISIEDANGCIGDTSVMVGQPNIISLNITITEPSCYGYSNGSFTVSAIGGTSPYLYSFNSSLYTTTTSYSGLSSGTDNIAVRDANGCLQDSVFTILQPTLLTITGLTSTNVSCYGGADGTITVNVAGATPPYRYAANASPFQFSNLLTGLSVGIQTVQVQDSHLCNADTTFYISQPQPLVFTGADTVNPTCQGYPDGSVLLYAIGGTLPYTYSLDNVTFYSNPLFTGLVEGTYTFYISDSNHCTNDTTITLTGYPHILIDNVQVTPPLCVGDHNGAILLSASGGVQPLSYFMTGSYTLYLPSGFDSLYSGEYVITVTDSKDCHKDTTVMVPQPDTIKTFFSVEPNECLGLENKGAIAAGVTGGTAPYTFVWGGDTLSNSPIISGLANGVYTVWITDAHQCKDTATTSVQFDDCCTPYIPNAFTPNNDGKDDYFEILYKGDMRIIKFNIYNRFGQEVFHTEYVNRAWDGKFNGVICEMGVYYYYAKIICGNKADHIQEFKGDVTLIR